MKTWISILTILIIFASCTEKTTLKNQKLDVQIIPTPKKMVLEEKALVLDLNSGITSTDKKLGPFLELFQSELQTLTGFGWPIVTDKDQAAITFQIAKNQAEDEYRIAIDNSVLVNAGSFQALAMARTTLLQLAKVDGEELLFPQLTLNDSPDAKYRGLLIDLARSWHSMETVKKLIDLASYYKTNYIQLHFTDDQSYTLPSKKYPKLPTPGRHYSFEDLEELESYSQLRGVTIIPELEMPGHAKSFIDAYPEIFGIKDVEENPYIINMGKEEVYSALEELIAEITPIFKASPYFHIGGDEARFTKVMDDPEVTKYMKENNLGNEEVHELYRHFLVRMNEVVKKYGKQTCIWEGFARAGNIKIPKDMIVYEFESLYQLPNELIEDGYTLVNASWKPLYVVNEKKWEPKTIYDWNLWRFQNWWSRSPPPKIRFSWKKPTRSSVLKCVRGSSRKKVNLQVCANGFRS
ncbi:family 20 glycosylhydrolase [Maribacter halichondriae]|uniref:family 20 glycosylhydrolase n=1 Tax=Maribacter halichondriae TaxID=2980554 RepID=UPI0023595D6F|nr:family 20 glycosylhydrolase [Maribacter sp. Hal144]